MKLAIAAALLAAACAAPGPKEVDVLMQRAHAYRGHPVYELLGALGAPSSQERIGPATWYAWDYQQLRDLQHWQCRLSVAVRDDGVIVHTAIEGNNAGCTELLRRLPQ